LITTRDRSSHDNEPATDESTARSTHRNWLCAALAVAGSSIAAVAGGGPATWTRPCWPGRRADRAVATSSAIVQRPVFLLRLPVDGERGFEPWCPSWATGAAL